MVFHLDVVLSQLHSYSGAFLQRCSFPTSCTLNRYWSHLFLEHHCSYLRSGLTYTLRDHAPWELESVFWRGTFSSAEYWSSSSCFLISVLLFLFPYYEAPATDFHTSAFCVGIPVVLLFQFPLTCFCHGSILAFLLWMFRGNSVRLLSWNRRDLLLSASLLGFCIIMN